ncbi:MAG TPA: pyridoxamine 5'-phosphate oxidase family protein [Pseudolysinimonas sp.]|jgi:uncharacterized protein YhbP (UPF0306 family)
MSDLPTQAVFEILAATRLLSLATVGPDGTAHINTAFFAFDPRATLFVFSPPTTEHARNLTVNASAAATIFDSHQGPELRRGLQLFGEMRMLDGAGAIGAHARFTTRFDDLRQSAPSYADVIATMTSRFFALTPHRVKIFDELLLNREEFVELRTADLVPSGATRRS